MSFIKIITLSFIILGLTGCATQNPYAERSLPDLNKLGYGVEKHKLFATFKQSDLGAPHYGFKKFCVDDRYLRTKLDNLLGKVDRDEFKKMEAVICSRRNLPLPSNSYVKLYNLKPAYSLERCISPCGYNNKFFDRSGSTKYVFNYQKYSEAILEAAPLAQSYLQSKSDSTWKEFNKARERINLLAIEVESRELANEQQKINAMNWAQARFQQNSKNKEVGQKICNMKNKAGYLERIAADKIQIRLDREITNMPDYAFFYEKSTKYHFNKKDRIIWDNSSNWAQCYF